MIVWLPSSSWLLIGLMAPRSGVRHRAPARSVDAENGERSRSRSPEEERGWGRQQERRVRGIIVRSQKARRNLVTPRWMRMSSGITTKQDVRRADSLVSKESEKGWSLGRRRDDEVNREVAWPEQCTSEADVMLAERFECAWTVLGRDPMRDGLRVECDQGRLEKELRGTLGQNWASEVTSENSKSRSYGLEEPWYAFQC